MCTCLIYHLQQESEKTWGRFVILCCPHSMLKSGILILIRYDSLPWESGNSIARFKAATCRITTVNVPGFMGVIYVTQATGSWKLCLFWYCLEMFSKFYLSACALQILWDSRTGARIKQFSAALSHTQYPNCQDIFVTQYMDQFSMSLLKCNVSLLYLPWVSRDNSFEKSNHLSFKLKIFFSPHSVFWSWLPMPQLLSNLPHLSNFRSYIPLTSKQTLKYIWTKWKEWMAIIVGNKTTKEPAQHPSSLPLLQVSAIHTEMKVTGAGHSRVFILSTLLCLSAHVKGSCDVCVVENWHSNIWACWLCEGIPWFWQGQTITYQLESVSCKSLKRMCSLVFVFKLAKMNDKIYGNNLRFTSFWDIVSNK